MNPAWRDDTPDHRGHLLGRLETFNRIGTLAVRTLGP
jgi:hypothetical protein